MIKNFILVLITTCFSSHLLAAKDVALCTNYRGKVCIKNSSYCFCRKDRVFCKKAGIEGFCVKGNFGCNC